MESGRSTDITRIVLFVLVIGILLAGSVWTLLPFLSGLIWATTIAVATWPTLLKMQQVMWGRRGLAVTVMILLVLLVFIVPFALAISALVNAARHSPTVLNDFMAHGLGPPPQWVASVPVLGETLSERWQTLAAGGPEALAAAVQPYARSAAGWAMAATGGIGSTLVLILLTIVLMVVMMAMQSRAQKSKG